MNSKASPLVFLFLVALLLRVGMVCVQSENLLDDRDKYLGIARNLASGQGFSDPDSGRPTAYRPPAYPVALTLVIPFGSTAAIATFHVLLGTLTVILTWRLARRLGLKQTGIVAAGLVAIDPLLLQYTTLPMTETFFTLLVTLLMAVGLDAWTPLSRKARPLWHGALTGVVFGLCALCRPTILAFGVLVSIWCWAAWFFRRKANDPTCLRSRRLIAVTIVTATAVTLVPWTARNAVRLGRPIVTTTHGGYTLLLGNNPVFYHSVVAEPWGTVWDGVSLDEWQQSLEDDLRREQPPVVGEVARDRWMYGRAIANISNEPGLFVRACLLRLGRFWNVAPLANALPPGATWGIAIFYTLVAGAAVAGIARLTRNEWSRWAPLALLLISFSAVHLLYWSNMRMRAPVVPVVALLAARGLCRRFGGGEAGEPNGSASGDGATLVEP